MSIGVIIDFQWDGCEDVYLGVDDADPNHLQIVEKWTSKEHYAKYREWAMAQEDTAGIMSYLVGEMKTTYLKDTGA